MGNERTNSKKTIECWSAYLDEVHSRIARRFSRPEVRERAYRYLGGLLADVGRKNSWQMAEAIGERMPRGYNTSSTTPDGTRTPYARTCASTSWSISAMKRAAS